MGHGDAARQCREPGMAVPKGAQSRLKLKQLDCVGQRERGVSRGGPGGFILPVRRVIGEPKPTLTDSFSPATSFVCLPFERRDREGGGLL